MLGSMTYYQIPTRYAYSWSDFQFISIIGNPGHVSLLAIIPEDATYLWES